MASRTTASGRPTAPAPTAPAPGAPGSGPADELVAHLVRTTGLPAGVAARVVGEVVAYFGEATEAFVRRRHRELQAAGGTNAGTFGRIAAELAGRPVAAPVLSERQLRRIVYG